MIRSMTGYGAGEARAGAVVATVELRAVNHRFFDPAIRISRDFAGLEGRAKELLGARIARGRIQATVDLAAEADATGLALNPAAARAWAEILRELRDEYRLNGAGDPVAFAQLPDVVKTGRPDVSPEDADAALAGAIDAALDELIAMRDKEGAALQQDLEQRVARLREILDSIQAASGDTVERAKDRLRERVAQLMPDGAAPDPDRLATEVAILADKADVTEELVRFRAHCDAFVGLLRKGKAVGKRLDFLSQEMNREANTTGSKSVSAEVTHLVVEAKEEIERLREQVQNVE